MIRVDGLACEKLLPLSKLLPSTTSRVVYDRRGLFDSDRAVFVHRVAMIRDRLSQFKRCFGDCMARINGGVVPMPA